MHEQRKVVTVLFADVVGSTELASHRDPEVVRSLMARYFKRVAEIATAYGGTVEKYAGDAAMVVFGVPAVHDDDAERAIRAALEIRDAASDLQVRVGVNTGEAVTAMTEDRQFMVSGDTVNVAARLQQGAEAGEVVAGALTHQLTRGSIDYESREPVAAKGKAEPLVAYRALRARSTVPVQARGVPGLHAELVGRSRELRLVLDTFARAAAERTPHLFTIVGAPGIGKSRLVSEALDRLAGADARVLRGRCLPYGRGITYWPLIEMVRADTGITLADDPAQALEKLDRWLGELMPSDAERPAVQTRLAVMLGLAGAQTAMPDTPGARIDKEIAWSVRRYLETLGRLAPLIVVFDDVQWAHPVITRLIEEIAERSHDVPLFIVCVARPEFFESGGWKQGMLNSTTITLDPLSADETATLVSRLLELEALPEELRRQIIERSAGTPLFCEEFIHMLIDEGFVVRDATTWRASRSIPDIQVPHEINAVLAARLDLLAEDERQLLQAASVIGERFDLAQVESLSGEPAAETKLESLRRKGLVMGGDGVADEYRFRHLLIRDAAYSSLPKLARASLHDRFTQLLGAARDPDLIVEILAYHAERSLALSRELALEPQVIAERAERALHWLFAVAERAGTRFDASILEPTLRSLRETAADLDPSPDVLAKLSLLDAQLAMIRGDYAVAAKSAEHAAALAEQASLWSVVARARLTEAWIASWTGEDASGELQRAADRAIEACRRAGDLTGEIEARHVGGFVYWSSGDVERFVAVNEALVEQARAAGDVAHVAAICARLVPAHIVLGHPDVVERHRREAAELAAKHGFRNVALRIQMDTAGQSMDRAEYAVAERQWRELVAAAEDAGARQMEISGFRFLGYTLLYAGRPREAADALDRALELSQVTGERWNRTELFALRSRAALDAGDLDAAERFIEEAKASARPSDLTARSELDVHLGALRAAQGRDEEAEAALRRAHEVVAETAFLHNSAPAAFHLALFLATRGRREEAAALVARYAGLVRARNWHLWDELQARCEAEIGHSTAI